MLYVQIFSCSTRLPEPLWLYEIPRLWFMVYLWLTYAQVGELVWSGEVNQFTYMNQTVFM